MLSMRGIRLTLTFGYNSCHGDAKIVFQRGESSLRCEKYVDSRMDLLTKYDLISCAHFFTS